MLPTGDFEWINPDMACQALHESADAEKGYILEVELEYSQKLPSAYPPAPERVKVDKA